MAQPTPPARTRNDPHRFDMRALFRLAMWGTSAATAVLVAALAGYPNFGPLGPHAFPAWAGGAAPKQPDTALPRLAARLPVADGETRQLAEAVRTLGAEREALLTRIAALERSLGDITGSLNRQTRAMLAPAAASSMDPTVRALPPGAMDSTAYSLLAWPGMAAGGAPETTPSRPAPPNVVEAAAGATLPKLKAEFGVDIGGAVNFDALRVLWNSSKAGYPALLDGFSPLVAVRENSKSRATELRLIVGPLADADAAAKLCAALTAAHRACQPAPFEGRPFALSVTEPENRLAPVPAPRAPPRPPARPPARPTP
jgi:hypothetical protein